MRALTFTPLGLELVTMPAAPLRPGCVRVDIIGCALNRADLLQRRGLYPPPAGLDPARPGLEFSGRVRERADDAMRFALGDAVVGLVGGEAQADEIVVDEALLLPAPPNVDLVDAAALPEAFVTAFDALVRGGLGRGDWVLLHAVGSGVGSAAVQLVRAEGAKSIGTSRSPAKLEQARTLGLDVPIRLEDALAFADAVRTATDGHGVDLVLDFLGGPALAENLRSLAPGGRLMQLGLLTGAKGLCDLGLVLGKGLRIEGSTLRSRSLAAKAELLGAVEGALWPRFARGELEPVVAMRLPLERAETAYEALAHNDVFGKIVLTV